MARALHAGQASLKLDSVHYTEIMPEGALHGRARFWRLTDPSPEKTATCEPVPPDGCVEVIVHLGDPFWIERDGQRELQPRVLLAGPGTRPVWLAPTGRVDVIGVRLEAGVASALVRQSLADFVDRIPALDSVANEVARDLAEELAEPRRGEEWTEVLERRLTPLLDDVDPAVERAVACVRASHGRATVRELAHEAGLSPRQLERRFHAHVGLGPKMLARITRFQRALRLAERAPTLAWVAARAGYFDQAHLVRDFRQFTGAPPGRFLAAERELARHFVT